VFDGYSPSTENALLAPPESWATSVRKLWIIGS